MSDKRVLYVGLFSLCACIPRYFLPSTKGKQILFTFPWAYIKSNIHQAFFQDAKWSSGTAWYKAVTVSCLLYALEQYYITVTLMHSKAFNNI